MINVFDVDPDRASLESALHHGHDVARRRPEPADDVRAQRYRQRASDPLGGRHEFLAFDHLTVRVTEGDHDPRARGGDCGKTFVLKDAGTWHVPGVRKNEEFLASMELLEFLGLSGLVLHDDRPPYRIMERFAGPVCRGCDPGDRVEMHHGLDGAERPRRRPRERGWRR